MATQAWPVTLPTSPLLSALSEEYGAQVGSFEPDVGLPSTWPRSSKAKLSTTVAFRLTNVQKDTLITFWKDTCKMGSLSFTWSDVVYSTTVTFRFNSNLRFSPGVGPRPWLVEFGIIRLA